MNENTTTIDLRPSEAAALQTFFNFVMPKLDTAKQTLEISREILRFDDDQFRAFLRMARKVRAAVE